MTTDIADPILCSLIERFATADCCWFTSVRPGGRPHSTPIWHVWYDGKTYVVTTGAAVKTANITLHPAVVLHHPDPMNPIIVEGVAVLAPEARALIAPFFQAKYDWDILESPDYNAIIAVAPKKLLAWGQYGEGRWQGPAIARCPVNRGQRAP